MKRFFRRLRFWLFQRGKQCKSCCVFCRFYDTCKLDFVTGDVAAAFESLGETAAKAGASTETLSEAFSEALKKASSGN